MTKWPLVLALRQLPSDLRRDVASWANSPPAEPSGARTVGTALVTALVFPQKCGYLMGLRARATCGKREPMARLDRLDSGPRGLDRRLRCV